MRVLCSWMGWCEKRRGIHGDAGPLGRCLRRLHIHAGDDRIFLKSSTARHGVASSALLLLLLLQLLHLAFANFPTSSSSIDKVHPPIHPSTCLLVRPSVRPSPPFSKSVLKKQPPQKRQRTGLPPSPQDPSLAPFPRVVMIGCWAGAVNIPKS